MKSKREWNPALSPRSKPHTIGLKPLVINTLSSAAGGQPAVGIDSDSKQKVKKGRREKCPVEGCDYICSGSRIYCPTHGDEKRLNYGRVRRYW